MVAHFGKADGSDQTNISGPDNGDFDVFTHSAVVLFLLVEDNRRQEESSGYGSNRRSFETPAATCSSNHSPERHTRVD
jgi:hypothetical protein